MEANSSKEFSDLQDQLASLHESVNALFLITMSVLIILMQGGFAFLEAGSVRSKNTVNILIKNMLDCLLGGFAYYAVGWAVAYGPGGNSFIGGSQFFLAGLQPSNYATWIFQFTFAATTATIVSGAIAERCQLYAYFIYSLLLTGLIYPPVSHWAWDPQGWLLQMGYQDFAGSCAVHMLSGLCSLVACVLMGPRQGRFDSSGKPVDMPGHSVPFAALGGFILIFGFLAFNGGSLGSIANPGDAEVVATSIMNTILGGCAGGLAVLFINKYIIGHKWSYLMTLNGTFAGMVAQCGGCNVFPFWAAIIGGVLGGLALLACHFGMLYLKLDDPLDATSVHGAAGLVGILLVPFFDQDKGVFWIGNTIVPWKQLGINCVGVLAISTWTVATSLILFGTLKFFNILRIDRETEFKGNDILKHGEAAYPAEAWVEMQYNKDMSIPSNMRGTNRSRTSFNNPFEMVPTAGAFYDTVNSIARGAEQVVQRQGDTISETAEGQSNRAFLK